MLSKMSKALQEIIDFVFGFNIGYKPKHKRSIWARNYRRTRRFRKGRKIATQSEGEIHQTRQKALIQREAEACEARSFERSRRDIY